jgi:L-lactate dehydrogenase complex protein LldG
VDRDAFLDRIAGRLGRARVRIAPARSEAGVPDFHREVDPAANLAGEFELELTAIGGRVLRARDWGHASALLRAEIEQWKPASIITWARAEFAGCELGWLWETGLARAVGDPGLTSEADLRHALFAADMGITSVQSAVAATGTVVVTASTTRPRAVSLVPPMHVALVRHSQIVAQMGAALGVLESGPAMPSAIHFVSGPSRTSDIENDLTIGVHGPAALVAIVVEAA